MKFVDSLAAESWVLFVLGVGVVVCRFISHRIKLGKWKGFGVDDYLMLFALVNFAGVVVSINEVAKNGSNYMPPETAANLTPEGVAQAVFGSKMTFVLEIFTLTATWTIKACLLILYHRLTKGASTKQHFAVKVVAGYCALTYLIVTFMFVFYWCHPTYEYWAVPVRILQCATYYNHMIFATACNISSDLMLLFIPIPIIIKTRLPTKRKISLCCVLGLGVFNILAAVLNRYYNFSNPNSYVFLYWYVAEVGIAMYVGNLPLCWPLFRGIFGSKGDSSIPSYPTPYRSGSAKRRGPSRHPLATTGSLWDKLDEEDSTRTGIHADQGSQIELVNQKGHQTAEVTVGSVGSMDEHSQVTGSETGSEPGQGRGKDDRIVVVTTVDVSSK